MIIAYLTFNGNTEEAFTFYANALGGEIKTMSKFGDTPHGGQMSDADKNKVMHAFLEAPDGVQLMGSDHVDMMGEKFIPGNNFSLSLNAGNQAAADALFAALSAGGKAIMPMGKVFWGDYFGMLLDKFGIKWLVSCAA